MENHLCVKGSSRKNRKVNYFVKAEACKNWRATQHLQLAVNGISRACLLCSRLWCYPSLAMIPLVLWCDTGFMTKVKWKSLDIAWIENACRKAVTSNWHQKQTLLDKNTLKIRTLSIHHDSAHLFPIQSKIPIRRVFFSHLCRLERSLPRCSREHLWPPIVCSTLCNSTRFWRRL